MTYRIDTQYLMRPDLPIDPVVFAGDTLEQAKAMLASTALHIAAYVTTEFDDHRLSDDGMELFFYWEGDCIERMFVVDESGE